MITACAKARELPRFSPRKNSVPRGTCVAAEPSAPAWIATTTRSARFAARRTSATASGMLVEPCRPRVGSEADERDARAVRGQDRDLAGRARPAHARLRERRPCLRASRRAEVERVVVRLVHDVEAGALQEHRVRRRRLERVAVRRTGRAFRARRRRHGLLEVPEREVGVLQRPRHVGQRPLAAVGREPVARAEHHVADPLDRDRLRRCGPYVVGGRVGRGDRRCARAAACGRDPDDHCSRRQRERQRASAADDPPASCRARRHVRPPQEPMSAATWASSSRTGSPGGAGVIPSAPSSRALCGRPTDARSASATQPNSSSGASAPPCPRDSCASACSTLSAPVP